MKRLLALFAVIGLLVAACGDDGGDDVSSGPAGGPIDYGSGDESTDDESTTDDPDDESDDAVADDAGGDGITIAGFAYQIPGGVAVGDTLEVTNDDGAPHTFTARDGSFGTEVLNAGDSGSVTFADAGTFEVFCEIHSSMSGEVTVE